jgi:hypothetical protein
MAHLAIKGHTTRGKEVIEILKMFGGQNVSKYNGTSIDHIYINSIVYGNCVIECVYAVSDAYRVFTLEEFLEKYPYKVGDKVYNIVHNETQTITDLAWDFQEDEVGYQTNNNEYVYVNYLQPYKEERQVNQINQSISMTKLAIRGHATRGKEVIEILEMLGGKIRRDRLAGNEFTFWYYINENGYIDYDHYTLFSDTIDFTLEEFLEKFPYKVGDKVKTTRINDFIGKIINAQWDSNEKQIIYIVEWDDVAKSTLSYSARGLQPYKEETMEENTDKALAPDLRGEDYFGKRFSYKIPNGYKFECVRNNEIILKPIKPKYPKTFIECAKILDCFGAVHIDGYKGELLDKLQELLICRNAYWKIAGEQMGLNPMGCKPWEFENPSRRYVFTIENFGGNILKNAVTARILNRILVFPTEEMRDAFYENFKELIEQCKEFL